MKKGVASENHKRWRSARGPSLLIGNFEMNKSSRFAGVSENDRLVCDLEFVQALSNVRYLHYLAINKFFADSAFMAYLASLRYWKDPEYARLLQFPQCLAFLDNLLENEEFRSQLGQAEFIDFVHQQQGAHWMVGADDLAPAATNAVSSTQ